MSDDAPHGTRERILTAALPLFAARGFDGTSTRQVAQAAGVNVATLAYHFDGKEGLYREVITRLHTELAAAMPAPVPAATPDAFVDGLAATAWRFARDHRVHIRLSLRHVLDAGRHPDVIMDAWVEPLVGRAVGLLGVVRPAWSEAERRILLFAAVHMVVRFALEDDAQLARMLGLPEDQVDHAVEGFLAATLKRQLGLGG